MGQYDCGGIRARVKCVLRIRGLRQVQFNQMKWVRLGILVLLCGFFDVFFMKLGMECFVLMLRIENVLIVLCAVTRNKTYEGYLKSSKSLSRCEFLGVIFEFLRFSMRCILLYFFDNEKFPFIL